MATEAGGWLFKQEPGCYSFADLQRDGRTVWDGVNNALARKHLHAVKVGDRVLYYHTGGEKAVVGDMRVVEGPRPDPTGDDPKAVVVTVEAGERWPQPVTLERIKQDALLRDWDLVRLPRLSVVPVSPAQWARLLQLRETAGGLPSGRRKG